jgi:hypothetical protein
MSKSGIGGRWALRTCAALLSLGLYSASARADEGQWPPGQLGDLDPVHLKSLGLELRARQLRVGSRGLLGAVVKLGDCSAAFVSPSGLALTSQHCIDRALRASSKGEHDYLAQGLLARKPGDELPAAGFTVEVLEDSTDVTGDIVSAANKTHDDAARERAIERAADRDVARCERRHPGRRCRVKRFYLGKEFKLLQLLELHDVRVVYAPPAGIARFGGSVVDGMWPRHAGDFAILRAYVGRDGKPADFAKDNVPFKPGQWLHLGDEGIEPGDFVAALGYPTGTRRYLPAVELARYVEQVLPARAGLYSEWVNALTRQAARSPAVQTRVAMHKQELERRLQTTRDLLEACNKLHLVEQGKRRQRRLESWCAAGPGRQRYLDSMTALAGLSAARRARFNRALLLDSVQHGPALLAVAVDLVRRARERSIPARQSNSTHVEKNAGRLREIEAQRLEHADPSVDGELLTSLVLRARGLPKAERIEAFDKLAGPLGDKQRGALVRKLTALVRRSRLSDTKHARELFGQADAAALDKSRDPMIVLARGVADAIDRLDEERSRERGTESRVAADYFKMLRRVQHGPVYPDANGTLRLSYGTVAGYEPEDGLRAEAQTTLRGAIDKSTGEKPFDLPRRLLDKAPGAAASYWADPDLDDLPVCFLSSADTSAGNAGGPVIDGRGHLVGLVFDRVEDDIASDFSFSADRTRAIGVDIRYMLWLLDRVDDAGGLLRELGVSQYRSAPSRRERAAAPRLHGPGVSKTHRGVHPNACGCAVPGGNTGGPRAWWLLFPALILRRRALFSPGG